MKEPLADYQGFIFFYNLQSLRNYFIRMLQNPHTICYVSNAKSYLTDKDLEHLHFVNKRNNTDLDISGVLIFNQGNFLQILEGEKQKIDTLFLKISQDPRHSHIIKLIDTSVDERIFNDYEAGFVILENSNKLNQLKNYLNWIKEAELTSVDKVIRIVENFIDET